MAGQGKKREKIVILGGGMAALTAAVELTRPGWEEHFESVTIYQVGWRLGGKAASGRGVHGRIEEHGLHLWLGFYENAFRVLRRCYEELGLDWRDAFQTASFVVLKEFHGGRWKSWPIMHPENARVPGVPDEEDGDVSLLGYLKKALALMWSLAGLDPASLPELPKVRLPFAPALEDLGRAALDTLRAKARGVAAEALASAMRLAESMSEDGDPDDPAKRRRLMQLLEQFVAAYARLAPAGDRRRRIGAILNLVVAHIRGAFADELFTAPGLARIDDRDYLAWLAQHGASTEALRSPIVRGFYDTAFAYRNGDPAAPAVAAGQALRGLLRFTFQYKGAIFWRMTAGMGDVVIAPFYEVLRRRGVRVRFFHRVKSLHVSADRRSIAAVRIGRQAEIAGGADYSPLVTVKGLPCWPAEPLYDQIANGDALRGHNLESFWAVPRDVDEVTLSAGQDFDRLVFGISLGAVPYVCEELIATSPRWKGMVDHVQTVHTQAFQLWLKASGEALGGPKPQATVGAFVEPFDTYADMRQLIEREQWPEIEAPRSIAYFCNAMPTPSGPHAAPDPSFPASMHEQVKANAVAFLQRDMRHIWPNALDPATGDFRWDLLCGGQGAGPARFASQYWRANVDPSDRYVLSLPRTDGFRLEPADTGYDNLIVVGDWTDCGFNLGCVEAAVMSGQLASHAIRGVPDLREIVGHRHP